MDARATPRRDWVFWSLLAVALLSRVVWVVWVHPPHEHVFSDMAHYVYRARLVAAGEVEAGMRKMVWQAWGTHALLVIPIVLLGPGQSALEFAGLMWAACSTATVVLGYRLAVRLVPGWAAVAVGLVLVAWVPLVSQTGFFISETPYACALLATTLALVRVVQDGRGALAAGIWGAISFVLRPQSAVLFALLGLAWLWSRARPAPVGGARWSDRVDARAAVAFALPLVIALALSMVRVRIYAGQFGGVAENANMNLTAGRCHNVVTRAYASDEELESARWTGSPRPLRRISLPGFRALAREGPDHPLALDPALGGEAIDMVGYIGERRTHREIRRRCWAATGLGGQLRYSATNVALLWFIARPWPESSDHGAPGMLPVAVRGRDLAAYLAPLSLLGMLLALGAWLRPGARRVGEPGASDEQAEAGRRAGLGICALQLASLLIVAAVFFGTPRLRTPYDPYALILAVAALVWIAGRLAEGLTAVAAARRRCRDSSSSSSVRA